VLLEPTDLQSFPTIVKELPSHIIPASPRGPDLIPN